MNNLDIVLALFTTLNHRFSRLDTTQWRRQLDNWGGGGGGGRIFIYSCSALLTSFEIDCFYGL